MQQVAEIKIRERARRRLLWMERGTPVERFLRELKENSTGHELEQAELLEQEAKRITDGTPKRQEPAALGIQFSPDALYSVEELARQLGCSKATVLRNFRCQVRIAGCVTGVDILKSLHNPEGLPSVAVPVQRPQRGRPCKNRPAAVQAIRGGRDR